MPGTLVAKRASTMTRPLLSVFTPTASRPSPAVNGTRPIDTSTTSASIDSAAPPAVGWTVALSVFPAASTPVTLDDSLKTMPCFSKRRWTCRQTSLSIPGRMRSRNSTTITLEPRRRLIENQGAGRGDDAPLVDIDAGQARHVRAGGDDDRLALDGLALAVGGFHL